MEKQLTVKKVLEKAIEKEVEAQQLYIDLSQKMGDEAVKEAFLKLAQQELAHEKLLTKYLRGELVGGTLNSGQVLDYKIAEHFKQPEISPEMTLQDTFLLAAKREKISHEFYLSLAEVHPPGEVRKILTGLAEQELEHKERVEFLYTEVAFPQTDGG